MKSTVRPVTVILAVLAAVSVAKPAFPSDQAPPPPQKTLFRDLPPNDPKRQIVQEVLNSSHLSMQGWFSSGEWTTGHYGGAWGRAQQYFPNHVYFTESAEYFMTHYFNPNGKLEMEVYNSVMFNLCLANRQTFTNTTIVGEYSRMRASDPAAAQSFQEKMGRLEPYFRDEASKEKLRNMLGAEFFNRLLEELSRENQHMLAGAMMHEGMHAEMDDDQLVRRIQSEYSACNLPVQWDELRAYMAEINYHSKYYLWAVSDINAHWGEIAKLCADLEAYRNRKKPLKPEDIEKIEEIKAKIKAHIALIRLRIRELWQSVQRMKGLMVNFEKEYLKPNAPPENREMVRNLIVSVNDFIANVSRAIQQTEVLLRALEQLLDLWNDWASCKLPNPPEKKKMDDIFREVRKIKWPAPPIRQVEEAKKKAEREIGKIPGSLPGGIRRGQPGGLGGGRQGFVVSGGMAFSSPSLTSLGRYLDYLNGTWLGDVPAFGGEFGFRFSLGWRFTALFEAGAFYERTTGKVTGTLEAVPSQYTSRHVLNAFGIYAGGWSKPFLSAVRVGGQVGAGYYAAAYRETENSFVTEGNDLTIGWYGSAGLDVSLAGGLSLTVTGGYQSAAFDNFGVSFFMPGSPPVTLEFSGFIARAGLSFRF